MRFVSFDAVDYRVKILFVNLTLEFQNPRLETSHLLIQYVIGDQNSDQPGQYGRYEKPLKRSHD